MPKLTVYDAVETLKPNISPNPARGMFEGPSGAYEVNPTMVGIWLLEAKTLSRRVAFIHQNYVPKPPQNGAPIHWRCMPRQGHRYGYRNVRTRCNLQGETPGEVSFTFIHHFWTLWLNLRCNIDNLKVLQPMSEHQTRVSNTVNLHSYLNSVAISCAPRAQTKIVATRSHRDGYERLWHAKWQQLCSFFWQWGVLWVRMGAAWRIGDVVVMYGNFGDKNRRFHLPAE